MRFVATVIILLTAQFIFGQQMSGIIEFSRIVDNTSIMTKLPFMSQEEIDRRKLVSGRWEPSNETFQFFFDGDKSVYQKKEEDEEYSFWRSDDRYLLIRDYKANTCTDQLDLLGKTYIIEEEVPEYKWKILNEIKEIQGYLCMKAETVDTVRNQVIHAWFSDALPVFAGPEGFHGLPGMILGLNINDGDAIIEATKITISEEGVDLPIPKRIRGKEITREEFNAKVKDHIEVSIEGERNPWWFIRY